MFVSTKVLRVSVLLLLFVVAIRLDCSAKQSCREDELAAEDDEAVGGKTTDVSSECGLASLNKIYSRRRKGYAFVTEAENATYGEWPSFVTLTYNNSVTPRCGGVLVGDKEVLTAAQCVHEDGLIPADKLYVSVGKHFRSNEQQERFRKNYKVESVCALADYNKNGKHENDLALVRLSTGPRHFSTHVRPACLPDADSSYKGIASSQNCWLVGIGHTQFDYDEESDPKFVPAKVLQKLRMTKSQCHGWLDYQLDESDESHICMAPTDSDKDKAGACHGDSGGPVLCYSSEKKRWVVGATVIKGSWACESTYRSNVMSNLDFLLPKLRQECDF